MGQQVSEKIKYTLLCVGLASVLMEWNETICDGALCMIAAFARLQSLQSCKAREIKRLPAMGSEME